MASVAAPMHTIDCQGRPLVYVVRFCGTEESSVASAIRQAIGVLDNFMRGQDAGEAQELVVVYRNRLPGAVTLQVGFPVAQRIADAAAGEVFAGVTPAGPMIEMPSGGELEDVLAVGARLPEGRASFTWQTFRLADFRPWRAHPSAPVLVPAEFADATTEPKPL
jgi:hypothetical protein